MLLASSGLSVCICALECSAVRMEWNQLLEGIRIYWCWLVLGRKLKAKGKNGNKMRDEETQEK